MWLPRGLGNETVLLGMVLDRPHGHPNNVAAIARQLGVDRKTARRLRDDLLGQGLVVAAGGWLVATDAGRAAAKRCDPLPRPLIAGKGERPSLEQLRAAAVVYADAVGWRADRRGCRSDAERAELAGVSIKTIRAARRVLSDRGLADVERLRRGRADLRRARLTEDRSATHGSPMALARAERLAKAAERGRARLRRGGDLVPREGGELVPPPMQDQRSMPNQRREARQVGDRAAHFDGWPAAPAPAAEAPEQGRGRTEDIGQVLARMGLESPRAALQKRQARQNTHHRAVADLARLANAERLQGLLRLHPHAACEQLLRAMGVMDKAPNRARGEAVRAARLLGPTRLLVVAADVLLSKPKSVGAVMLYRLRQAAAGNGELLTRCRAQWALGEFLDALQRKAGAA